MKEFWKNIWIQTKKICRRLGNREMWCKVGSFCRKFMTIPSWLIVLLALAATAALCYVFINGREATIFAYISYGVSAYAFGAVCVAAPSVMRKLKAAIDKSEKINYIRNHEITKRLTDDKLYRGRMVLYKGLITSMLFAAFKMVVAIVYHSVWFGAVAVYYLALSGMRYLLVKYMKKADEAEMGEDNADKLKAEDEKSDIRYQNRYQIENRGYKLCGYLMILLNVAMAGMTVQMVVSLKGYSYPGYIIYVSAMYTFYTLTMSVINIVKYRKLNSPVISAAKVISLASALMSILTLQTAMLAQFGSEQKNFIRLMNSMTGGAVCLAIFVMAIMMVCKARKESKAY